MEKFYDSKKCNFLDITLKSHNLRNAFFRESWCMRAPLLKGYILSKEIHMEEEEVNKNPFEQIRY